MAQLSSHSRFSSLPASSVATPLSPPLSPASRALPLLRRRRRPIFHLNRRSRGMQYRRLRSYDAMRCAAGLCNADSS
ncbi:hypothetical protein EX30DRAFT_340190 [Ascodesmis nigricans]|uniref:Uncharacterized protein n=1 Tax=Ascodesmis nigricans TaxID=341454 RepID=A0A4S2N059_9PEZI|nr:hypothetical protein EX30DRAFT_340190 [Ascodesmis nigricans]